MSLLQALTLGLVQGLTEFIPVSSSAHLVLVPWLLGWTFDPAAAFAFDVLVQLGTLVAVIVYFWRDLVTIVGGVLDGLLKRRPFATPEARLGWLVVLATIPAVLLGFLFKDFFESVFGSPVATAALLLVTATLLVAAERLGRPRRNLESLTWLDALVVGVAQAIAILPGVSRSGATIAGGLARGLERPAAARFSFLMSIPVMIGAGVLAANDLLALPNFGAYVLPILAGFLAALLVGYACIRWLLGYLARHSLYVFAAYCAAAGVLCLAVALLRQAP
jgi:undecaprenyl-diphosphatase